MNICAAKLDRLLIFSPATFSFSFLEFYLHLFILSLCCLYVKVSAFLSSIPMFFSFSTGLGILYCPHLKLTNSILQCHPTIKPIQRVINYSYTVLHLYPL